ncbi:unnamed protein product [Eruca vesicaria subsp. sativa]|uniref:Uncharacterized protein n=1 Tax=Eruca vesicaria subsp. sativa TaxID=29727 RepID=A0ABC8LMP1_ERUVS|nr:unnamed protein product [Eruca vesicaria subsp. sativa]
MSLPGASVSVKTKGESDVSSAPVKTGAQSVVSSADLSSMKSKGVAAGSSSPIKPIVKTGASSGLSIGGRGKAIASSGARGKAIVSDDVGETSYLCLLRRLLEYLWIVITRKPSITSVGKVSWFECTATIDDVVHGFGWYYIGCGDCHTKRQPKGLQHLCVRRVGRVRLLVFLSKYLSKISVYDHKDQAIFVLLGDSGEELFGKKASELVETYYQANESVGEDHIVPVPQAMIDSIGQNRKFIVKVSSHNLIGKTQALTVTKVLPLEAPEANANVGVNVDDEPDNEGEGHADEPVKRGHDGIELDGGKRARCG